MTKTIKVKEKANVAARIFELIGWLVVVVGSLGVVIALLSALVGLFSDVNRFAAVGIGLLSAIGIIIYTAILWASVTLATAVAGYIAQRSEQ